MSRSKISELDMYKQLQFYKTENKKLRKKLDYFRHKSETESLKKDVEEEFKYSKAVRVVNKLRLREEYQLEAVSSEEDLEKCIRTSRRNQNLQSNGIIKSMDGHDYHRKKIYNIPDVKSNVNKLKLSDEQLRHKFKIKSCSVGLKRLDTKFVEKKLLKTRSTNKTDKENSDLLSKEELRSGSWLTDREINRFLDKLKEYTEYSGNEITGLHDPLFTSQIRIKDHPPSGIQSESFVEILNSGHDHWVCVCAGNCIDEEDLCLYDSLPRKEIDAQLGTSCSFFTVNERLTKGYLLFKVMDTQKQKKDSGLCGYFALANATALCSDLDPETLHFDQDKLVEHFINIVYNNAPFKMFPHTIRKNQKLTTTKPKYQNLIFSLHDLESIEYS